MASIISLFFDPHSIFIILKNFLSFGTVRDPNYGFKLNSTKIQLKNMEKLQSIKYLSSDCELFHILG